MSKTRITFYLPQDLIEKAKNAVYWTPGMTLSGLAEEAIDEMLNGLEGQRNQPFPQRESELSKGRPAK